MRTFSIQEREDIGVRVQQARESRHLTQEQLAAIANVSVSHISKIESSNGRFGELMLYKLADLLKVRRQWLETGDGPRELEAEDRRVIMPRYPEENGGGHEVREKKPKYGTREDSVQSVIALMLDKEKQQQAEAVAAAMKLPLSRAWEIVVREAIKDSTEGK